MVMNPIPRPEHPRPDFMRDTFFTLNGQWQFAFDDEDRGLSEGWFRTGCQLPMEITVPFCHQSSMSGIGDATLHPILWYRRAFQVPECMKGQRVLLRFGAVDDQCSVFVNGQMIGAHEGGYTPFDFDITPFLCEGENDLCLRVVDAPDCTQPRGKQHWGMGGYECWYTPVSGIWQTVYLEAAPETRFRYIHVTPDVDQHMATVEVCLNHMPRQPYTVRLSLALDGRLYRAASATGKDRVLRVPIDMAEGCNNTCPLWWPDSPELFDVDATLLMEGQQADHVRTYFGMRKIHVSNGEVYLNNRLLYQRLVLDQGYWTGSLLTPPTDEAIRADLEATKALGFNGARKHQKIEDPRYYYWADRMGLLVWGEMPSMFLHSDESVRRMSAQMLAFIERDFNHPCIITWVPLNESWGVREIAHNRKQQALGEMLYAMTKAADGTRLCSSNDGWEQTKTDICALHDYTAVKEELAAHFTDRRQVERAGNVSRASYAEGTVPTGEEPLLVTEYGGIAYAPRSVDAEGAWGYFEEAASEEAFLRRFQTTTDAIREIPFCQGWCYTQLTDVQQEINGLMTMDRQYKIAPEKIAACNYAPADKKTRGCKKSHHP